MRGDRRVRGCRRAQRALRGAEGSCHWSHTSCVPTVAGNICSLEKSPPRASGHGTQPGRPRALAHLHRSRDFLRHRRGQEKLLALGQGESTRGADFQEWLGSASGARGIVRQTPVPANPEGERAPGILMPRLCAEATHDSVTVTLLVSRFPHLQSEGMDSSFCACCKDKRREHGKEKASEGRMPWWRQRLTGRLSCLGFETLQHHGLSSLLESGPPPVWGGTVKLGSAAF